MLLVIVIVIKLLRFKSWERYYYEAFATAPRNHPVYIRNAYFILADGEIRWIDTNPVHERREDWGADTYTSTVTKERLPVKLVLGYASYRDSAFYKDTIDLPVNIIEDAFKHINETGITNNAYGTTPQKRLDFAIGVANKGNIIVWLRGNNNERVLLKHHIKPHKPVGDDTYYNGLLSKAAYFKEVFYIDSNEREAILKGIDAEANYIDTPSHFSRQLK